MFVTNHPIDDYGSVVDQSTQFLDVRNSHEVASGTLPGTINIPLDELPRRATELDRTRRVVLVCRSGGRSAMAADFLAGAGFTDVVNLDGGLLAYGGAK